MYSVSKNNFIYLTRGDTFTYPLFINVGTKMEPIRYDLRLHPKAVLYLGVTEPNQPFEEAVIKKIFNSTSNFTEEGDLLVDFKTTDTEFLMPGKYYYEIKLQFHDGKVATIVPKTEFLIME